MFLQTTMNMREARCLLRSYYKFSLYFFFVFYCYLTWLDIFMSIKYSTNIPAQVYKEKKSKSFNKHAEKVKENTGSQDTDGMDFGLVFLTPVPLLVLI